MRKILKAAAVLGLGMFLTINGTGMCAQPQTVYAATSYGTVLETGSESDTVTWTIYDSDDDGTGDTMVVSGTGEFNPQSNYSGSNVAARHNEVEKVIIEEGITEIGYYALWTFDTALKEMYVPASVEKIGIAYAPDKWEAIYVDANNKVYKDIDGVLFSKDGTVLYIYPTCRAGEEYTVPAGVTTLAQSAFDLSGNVTLKKLVLAGSIKEITNSAIMYGRLTSIEIPEGVETIDAEAIYYCSYLTSLSLPSTIKELEPGFIYLCSAVDNVTIAAGNAYYKAVDDVIYTKDGKQLVYYAPKINATEYVIPDGVTNICKAAFSNCNVLKKVTIPEGVTVLPTKAFNDCSALETVKLPDSLLVIETSAFTCRNLLSLTIPANVREIQESFATYSSKMESIDVAADNKYYKSIDGVLFTKDGTHLIKYAGGSDVTEYTIPEGVVTVDSYSFSQNAYVTKVIMPKTLKYIAEYAFYGTTLAEVELNEGLISIGMDALSSTKLTALVIPETVLSLGEYALYGNRELASVIAVNPNMQLANSSVFSSCKSSLVIYGPADCDLADCARNRGITYEQVKHRCFVTDANGDKYYYRYNECDSDYTGMVMADNTVMYVKNGKFDTTAKGIIDGYKVENGVALTASDGIVRAGSEFWYMADGKVDTEFVGLYKNGGSWWYIKDGRIQTDYKGMVDYSGYTWYVANGKVDISFTGLGLHNGVWYCVQAGKVNMNYSGLVQNGGSWWYVKNGVLDTTVTGIVETGGAQWLVGTGKLQSGYTGKYTYLGVVYNIVNGKVI